MDASRHRFDLKFLCVLTIIPAAYLGGWRETRELTRVATLSNADAARLRQECRTLEQKREAWQKIALDRHATDTTGAASRRRWKIITRVTRTASSREGAEEMDRWGIQLAMLMPGETQFHRVSDLSSGLVVTRCTDFPAGSEIIECEDLDAALLAQAGLRQDAGVAFRVLPPELVEQLIAAEASHLAQRGIQLSDVVETTFRLSSLDPRWTREPLVERRVAVEVTSRMPVMPP